MKDRIQIWLHWLIGSRRAVLALFGLFVALRVLAICGWVSPSSDADWYFARAAMLARGQGYLSNAGLPTAYWPPGWPMALSLAFRLGGISILTVGLFNLLSATIGAWLVLDLGRHLSGSEAAARLGLLLYAIYPNAILYVPLALTEVFYTTLLLGGCWLLVARPRAGEAGWPWLVLAGTVFGMATLVKAQTLVVVPLVLAIGLWRQGNVLGRLPATIGKALLLLGVAALVVSPWTARNKRELGAWVAVSTNGGITLLTGNNDSATGDFTPDDPVVRALDARRDLNELQYDAEAKRLGLAWIKAHPARFVGLMPRKAFRLWGPDGEGMWAWESGSPAFAAVPWAFKVLRVANQAFYIVLLGLFALAAWVQARARWLARQRLIDWWLLPFGIALYPTAICVIFSGQSRFHYPVMPFVCLTAGWLLLRWIGAPDIAQSGHDKARAAG
ncbi:ArnT family glycosyltransferase [Novosphingobium sp.]|uniref:ArnT family glycosyltransferase n=1 Tax=Novosphingobium sp. TaxID=1874826 RepID=UPI0038BD2CD7